MSENSELYMAFARKIIGATENAGPGQCTTWKMTDHISRAGKRFCIFQPCGSVRHFQVLKFSAPGRLIVTSKTTDNELMSYVG